MTAEGREVDESSIIVHDLLEVVQSIREHPVEFSGKNSSVSRNDAFALQDTGSETKVSEGLGATGETRKVVAYLVKRDLE